MIEKSNINRDFKLGYYKNIIEVYQLYKIYLYYYNQTLLYFNILLNNMLNLKYYKLKYINI